MAAMSHEYQLARVQSEIDKVSAKIEAEEFKPKADRDASDLAAWREEKKQLNERMNILLKKQQPKSDFSALQRIEKKLDVMDGRQVSIEGEHHEAGVRSSLVVDLWNSGQGISMSAAYQRRSASRRKFPEADGDRAVFASEPWKKAHQAGELEMDFVGHTSTTPSADCSFGPRIHVVQSASSLSASSSSSSSSSSRLGGDISPDKSKAADNYARTGEAQDAERRFYVVFEITRGAKQGIIKEKLKQLERDLSFLLMRRNATLQEKEAALSVLDIVGFAGIATPQDNAAVTASKKLLNLPLLQQLASAGRLLVFIGQPSLFEVMSESTNVSPTSPAIAAERLKQEKLRTRKEEMAVKKEEMAVKKEEIAVLTVGIESADKTGDTELRDELQTRLRNLMIGSSSGLRGGRGRGRGRGHGRGRGRKNNKGSGKGKAGQSSDQ